MSCPRSPEEVYRRIEEGGDDEHAASCPSCREARRVVARLREVGPATGAGLRPPSGWQAEILAQLDGDAARGRVAPARRWARAAPIALATAAVLVFVAWRLTRPVPGPIAALDVELSIERGGEIRRATSASVGDVAAIQVVAGGDRAALWIYRDGAELVLRCPGGEGCAAPDGAITARLRLARPGTYQVLAVDAPGELPAPGATVDESVRAAGLARARTRMAELEVR